LAPAPHEDVQSRVVSVKRSREAGPAPQRAGEQSGHREQSRDREQTR